MAWIMSCESFRLKRLNPNKIKGSLHSLAFVCDFCKKEWECIFFPNQRDIRVSTPLPKCLWEYVKSKGCPIENICIGLSISKY